MFKIKFNFVTILAVIIISAYLSTAVPLYAMGVGHESVRAQEIMPTSMHMDDEGDMTCFLKVRHSCCQANVDVLRNAVVSAGDCVEAVSNVLFGGTSTVLAVEALLSDNSCLHIMRYNPHVVEVWGLSGAVSLVAILSSALCPVKLQKEISMHHKQD